ncbi:uncharacterized protein PAC_19103 [Phialocephala subalpina]|uniref:SMP-30/Gluconolactonase/LRE-like region domain-containing protein n=1 Tax=Phialocephala subalpina TaxID=576137 RepID=A0A1L7XVZ0_9HELO|nr:uncharacterized protein PAC_19103 [Phialocephala subalpina]
MASVKPAILHYVAAIATATPQLLNRAGYASKLAYFGMLTALAGPCDLTTSPDGAIWAEDILVDEIARVDVNTGDVTEYDIPFTNGPVITTPEIASRGALACAIQPGNDGMLYAASGIRNQFVRINPTAKNIDVFTQTPFKPLGNLQPLNDLWLGPTGMFFSQTTNNVILHFDYKTEEFTNWEVPTPLGGPVEIYYASDDGLRFCEFTGQKIGRLNATDGTFKEYPIPLTLLGPVVMRAETQGQYLWFAAFLANAIGRIDMYTREIDGDGNIRFSTATQNTLNNLTPSTGEITTVQQPGTLLTAPISVPPAVDIATHYGPGNAIWFTEVANNRIGRYNLD